MTLRDRLKRDLGKHRYKFIHLAEEAGITPCNSQPHLQGSRPFD